MSGDSSGEDGDGYPGDDTGTPDGVPPSGEVHLTPVPHSSLVGLMAEPISRTVPVRRSTVLMLVFFLGFGTLTYLYPPAGPATTTVTTTTPGGRIPDLIPAPTTTSTHPVTTTTVAPTASTGPEGSTTTSTRGPGATSTTRPSGSTTTVPVPSTTTSTPGGAATTTTAIP
jgi:hypothetical protein